MKKNLLIKMFLLSLLIHSVQETVAQKNKKGIGYSLNKTTGNPSGTRFNINNIGTFIYNDGRADVSGSNPGYYFPKQSKKTANFQSGLLWGGYLGDVQDSLLKVGGSYYRTTLSPGRILNNGSAQDPNGDSVRIFRVRRDYKRVTPLQESYDENKTTLDIYAQYEKDWNEWPVNEGAPFEDIDHDGIYNPSIDIPGVPGAEQTIWFAANDLVPTWNGTEYGFSSLNGIEIQCTVWGFYEGSVLDNMFFKKYLVINKNKEHKPFNNFYISYWSDTDIGGGSYDFCGCDSTLGLFYTYCAVDNNPMYGNNSPATGFVILQGPIVKTNNPQDYAIVKGKHLTGYKNIPMTAHYYKFQPLWGIDKALGTNAPLYVQWWYNYFQGKLYDGQPYIDPTTHKPTKFPLAGDPVARTGWNNGITDPPRDVRNGGACGPFNFAYGDTQEVIIAQISAGASPGVDRLGAVQLLKHYASVAKLYYNDLNNLPTEVKEVDNLPTEFILFQNYPNPFNPSTTISYQLSTITHVSLKVYDMLGREVATLVNEEKSPGNYKVKFEGTNLPSGVYFCRMQAGSFSQAKKLVLLK